MTLVIRVWRESGLCQQSCVPEGNDGGYWGAGGGKRADFIDQFPFRKVMSVVIGEGGAGGKADSVNEIP
ncbi:hypothetical protein chiPu_0029092, partial [Chiloscyllium punctatum]|nr:hypothetical protein [Chiloscyllium punctatum]